jgi:hypothetical protein
VPTACVTIAVEYDIHERVNVDVRPEASAEGKLHDEAEDVAE